MNATVRSPAHPREEHRLVRPTLAAAGAVLALCASAAPAGAQVRPDRGDVLPPGTNGRANALELASFLATKTRPRHSEDQRDSTRAWAAPSPA